MRCKLSRTLKEEEIFCLDNFNVLIEENRSLDKELERGKLKAA